MFICDECIDLCNEIIRDELPAGDGAREARSDLPTPAEIKTNLDNYRMIATSTAMAKLYQNVLDKRIRAAVEPALDRNQYGFRPRLSALQASITLRSAQACAIMQHCDMDTIYQDIRKAYPSVQHHHVIEAARAS